MMKQEQYIKTIVRRLQCTGGRKKEIARELEADIQSAIAGGESWEQVQKRMGSPALVASEFNRNFPEKERKGAQRKRRIRIFVIIAAVLLAAAALIWWLLPKNYPLGKHGVFDEKTVVDAAEKVISLLDDKDYDSLEAMSTDSMKKVMNQEKMDEARSQVGDNWGGFQSFGSVYSGEVKDSNGLYAVVQLVAVYENRTVTYTISFNEEMELAGLYMK